MKKKVTAKVFITRIKFKSILCWSCSYYIMPKTKWKDIFFQYFENCRLIQQEICSHHE